MNGIEINSVICPPEFNTCFPVKTTIPWWITAILIGSSVLIIKEIYSLTKT